MSAKQSLKPASRPEKKAPGTGRGTKAKQRPVASAPSRFTPSIHLIRIPEVEHRRRAIGILIATEEAWVRLPGNLIGVSTRQVAALEIQHISFDWVSQAPSDG
jgi:hypothetical protein